MSASVKAQIMQIVAERLKTITTANFYSTDVKEVYFDTIPMGIDLNDYQLPAIFLMDRMDNIVTNFQDAENTWEFALQLWHQKVPDSTMYEFVRDVYKAIYAGSPTAETNGAFRMHPYIVEFKPGTIVSDLQMIEANRVLDLTFTIKYRTKLYNL
jgi:hypothetical protein